MHFNKAFKDLDITEYLSVDESIVPYYGHHGLKQFIRGKPIRFDYKLWVLSSSDGLLFHAEPYCGASTNLSDTGLGQGADVVLGLLGKCKIPDGTHVVMDNFFTGIPLLKELSKRGIAATGTMRENRQMNAPLSPKNIMKKTPRGTYESVCTEDIVIGYKPLTITHKQKNEQRYDQRNHWIIKSEQKHARCKKCCGRTGYKCEKCNQPLHPECHKSYHLDSNV